MNRAPSTWAGSVAPVFLFVCLVIPPPARGQNAISTGTNAGFRMYRAGTNDWWLDPSKGNFDIRMNGNTAMATLNSSGYLGIGTTGPASRLHISSGALTIDGNTTKLVISRSDGSQYGTGAGDLGITFNNGSVNTAWQIGAARPGINQNGLQIVQNGVEKMFFDSNGRVGIGSFSSAQSNLDISGNLSIGSYAGVNAAPPNGLIVSGNVGIGTTSPGYKLDVTGDINLTGTLRQNGTAFSGGSSQWSGTSPGPIYYNGGNVGIGTASPAANLHVVGSVVPVHWGWSGSPDIGWLTFTDSGGTAVMGGLTGKDLVLTSGAAERVRISASSGNVGVGTASPGAKLEVAGGSGRFSGLANPSSGAGVEVAFDGANGVVQPYDRTNNVYRPLYMNGSTLLINTGGGTGNVGVGTTSPAGKLDVQDASPSDSYSLRVGTSATAYHLAVSTTGNVGIGGPNYASSPYKLLVVDSGAAAEKVQTSGAGFAYLDAANAGGLMRLGVEGSSAGGLMNGDAANAGVLTTSAANPLQLGANFNAAVTILPGGNVGIGTANPVANLHISGTGISGVNARFENTGTGGVQHTWANANQTWSAGIINGLESSPTRWSLYDSTYAKNPVTVLANSGNVGIGTTAPNNALQVANLINFNNANDSTSLGYLAGASALNTTNYGTNVGYQAGYSNVSGASNSYLGLQAGFAGTSGANNTAVGFRAGFNATTGSNNSLFGFQAGYGLTTGGNNLEIGYYADAIPTGSSNMLNIGNLIFGNGVNGTGSTLSSGNVGIGTASPGQKLDVVGGSVRSDTGFCIGASCIAAWPSGGGISGSGSSGQVAFWNGSASQTGDANLFWDNTAKGLGVGGPPSLSLDVAMTGTYDGIRAKKTSDTSSAAPIVYFDRLKSAAAPSQGDMLGWIRFRALVEDDAWIQAVVDSPAGGSVHSPAALLFHTNPQTGLGAPMERMRITSAGSVGIGTTSPGQKLDVAGGSVRSDTGFCIGTNCITVWPSGGAAAPTRTVLTSGSATYATPANAKQLKIRMVGGGGGGGGTHSGAAAGGPGGTTSFNSITALGGTGGGPNNAPGAGGGPGLGTASVRITGSNGGTSIGSPVAGGSSPFGGAGQGVYHGPSGVYSNASANSGSGAGGDTCNGCSPAYSSGGGAGEYVEIMISNPASAYPYAVGAGGTAGGGAFPGGTGGSGIIIIDESY